jgi:N-acetylated-alpha-linked acidic dipeptidase
MKLLTGLLLVLSFVSSEISRAQDAGSGGAGGLLGFHNSAAERKIEIQFLAVPDPALAEEHLRVLTQAPHMAGSVEDKATADYVAKKFREAGLETEIVEYRVWMNYPLEISVDVTAPANVTMHGPSREQVASGLFQADPFQEDSRISIAFNGMAPSGDVEAEVVYANYGTPEDFDRLEQAKVDVRGKIILARYGKSFRGVKAFVAQEHGAAGVILYSDPADDGFKHGDVYPRGPWRPDSAVQRGSVGYMFFYPGDPTTPGFASLPSLPESKRVPPEKAQQLPAIPITPLSYKDIRPILESMSGTAAPAEWQGAGPFTYHLGPGPVRVKIHLKQDYQYRTIWDVIGRAQGSEMPAEWVVAGNHRDAWVYGAVDPNSGTAAMLETVHGIGELLRTGWRPKRSLVFGSWDAEEEGLIGSTEWGEQHAPELERAVAYLNMDAAVSGPDFSAAAVPSLKEFVRQVSRDVPSPAGGSLYEVWHSAAAGKAVGLQTEAIGSTARIPAAQLRPDVPVGDLGSGSDYTVFLQHLGIPSTDVSTNGPYGVYHSAFDNFAWFKKFGDPEFRYEQQMARVFGLEALRLTDCDVLPFDFEEYANEIGVYIRDAEGKADRRFGRGSVSLEAADKAARRFAAVGAAIMKKQQHETKEVGRVNRALHDAERALLLPEGLPGRPWFRHAIYAPGRYTGYAAVVIPGVNEALDSGDRDLAQRQAAALAAVLNRASDALESIH